MKTELQILHTLKIKVDINLISIFKTQMKWIHSYKNTIYRKNLRRNSKPEYYSITKDNDWWSQFFPKRKL